MTKIGIFGGSGFYELFEEKEDRECGTTCCGEPSAKLSLGMIGNKKAHTFTQCFLNTLSMVT